MRERLPLTARWWNLPQFYPQPGVTAYSEHLLGLSPMTTPIVKLTGNPLLAYNAAFLLSFVLCGLSAHLLAYVLTRRHDIGVLAGLAFAFAPYRMSQIAHLQVLSAYWMPLALTALHLYFADRRPRWLMLFGVSWLMQALACGYYLFYLSTLDRALAHLVRRRPRALVAYCARDRDAGASRRWPWRRSRTATSSSAACVWPAPLAGGDRVVQRRHRQRAQGVRLALDLGLARRRRASGVGAVSRPDDRCRACSSASRWRGWRRPDPIPVGSACRDGCSWGRWRSVWWP